MHMSRLTKDNASRSFTLKCSASNSMGMEGKEVDEGKGRKGGGGGGRRERKRRTRERARKAGAMEACGGIP